MESQIKIAVESGSQKNVQFTAVFLNLCAASHQRSGVFMYTTNSS